MDNPRMSCLWCSGSHLCLGLFEDTTVDNCRPGTFYPQGCQPVADIPSFSPIPSHDANASLITEHVV